MFTEVEKMDAFDKIRSTSFSTSVSANADLWALISLLQLSTGTQSTDLLLSFVSDPQRPSVILRNEQLLFIVPENSSDF